jgi:hypothetical protein
MSRDFVAGCQSSVIDFFNRLLGLRPRNRKTERVLRVGGSGEAAIQDSLEGC